MEVTILMPCLDEERTIQNCVFQAGEWLSQNGIQGEILVADNGSTDSSRRQAEAAGARVIHVPVRGYGAAIQAGINAARGTYVMMGDADGSYDFSSLSDFLALLRQGFDLVVGNRFRGGIAPGAMPPLHRYFGTPALSLLGRLLFPNPCRDIQCGLRGFRREAILAIKLRCTGMEYASEMIIQGALHGIRITEVPIRLFRDGRGRPSHLRTWHDGWGNLRLLVDRWQGSRGRAVG